MSRGSLQKRGKIAMSNADIRGRFVWHELMTTDPDAASEFYSSVVPWTTQDSGMPSYTLWMSGKNRAGGLMALPEDDTSGTPPHWIIYIATPDVDETVEQAQKLGGKLLKPASDIPNVGRFAVLSDPQGAAFVAFTPSPGSGEGVSAGGGPGDFGWHELSTIDPEGALKFYAELFGWSKGAAHDMGEMGVYQLVSHEGKDVGGIYKARDNSTPPSWLSYVNVPDAAKAASAAKAAGGKILNGPMEVPGGSWIVMMLDPQGGAFAVVEPPKAAAAKARKAVKGKAKAAASAPTPAQAKTAANAAGPESAPEAAKAGSKKAPARKAAARKAPAKKAPAKKSAAKTSGRKTAGKKPAVKRAAAKKSTSAKRGSAAKKAPAKKAPAKKGSKKKAKSKK
jgi:predicted enzyme related to lactoylglutathione lyase